MRFARAAVFGPYPHLLAAPGGIGGAPREPERVGEGEGGWHVRVVVGGGSQSERVGGETAAQAGVVVSVDVVVRAGLRIAVLARVAQGCVGSAVAVPLGGSPGGAAGTPGDGPVGGDEFAGGAGEVGDDGEDAPVDGLLLAGDCGFALGQGVLPQVAPRQRYAVGVLFASSAPSQV